MAVDLDALLTALKTDPVAREAIRRELLTEELLALPARMDQLTAQVTALAAAQGRTEERLAQLTAALAQLTVQVEKLAAAQVRTEERLHRVEGTVNLWRGTHYERAALRTPWIVAAAVGAGPQAVRALPKAERNALVAAAMTAGVLTPEMADAIVAANGIFVWERAPGAPPVYCVVEASVTAHRNDVDRAIARAAWLARTGVETRAVVLSNTVAADAQPAIDAKRVAWRRRLPPKAALPFPSP